jgi:hypothetical protein
MKKKIVVGLAIGLFIMLVSESPSEAALTSISNEITWQTSAVSWSTVDFEGFLGPVTTQYPGVVFSGFNGGSPYTTTVNAYEGQNSMFTAIPMYAGGCGWSTEFASPITGVAFWSLDVQFIGSTVSVFNSAGTLLGSYDLMGSGGGHGPFLWGFNGFISDKPDIKRITLSIVETDAIWFDNLQHTPVPVPAAFWLLVTGLVGLIGIKHGLSK